MNPFTRKPSASIAALGERGVISEIRRWLGPASPASPFGLGDDCAVVPRSRALQLVTVDPVIYGQHFDDSVSAGAAGAKLFKRNLSDIAAMGGVPRVAVVALAIDPCVSIRWLEQFYRGIARVSRTYDVPIVGGDVAQLSGGIVATLTLLGAASPRNRRILTRSGARAGDWICVTGCLGGSRRSHHWSFTPRLREGEWLAGRPEVVAMMDVSDGLAKDLDSLTPGGTIARLDPCEVPLSRQARAASRASGLAPLAHALGDGEDYELAFVIRDSTDFASFARVWKRAFPRVRLSRIGRFFRRSSISVAPVDWIDAEIYGGFEHLRLMPRGTPHRAPTRRRT
ncbi:MAG: thiamine-monophosphate kinase [Opitutaceae bacterium]|nr:thiamine-monophosphate kinase [Opitutaceae bacterium]